MKKVIMLLLIMFTGISLVSAADPIITKDTNDLLSVVQGGNPQALVCLNGGAYNFTSVNNIYYANTVADISTQITNIKNSGVGGILVIESGEYYINSEINISSLDNTLITGEGNTTLFHNMTGTENSIFVHETGTLKNFEISNLNFESELSYFDRAGFNNRNIRIVGGENIKIHDLVMEYPSANHTHNATNEYAPTFGIQLNTIDGLHVYNNRLINFGWYPLEIELYDNVIVENNFIRTAYYGISGGGITSNRIKILNNNILSATNFPDHTYGIYLENYGGESIISSNYIVNATGSGGIRLDHTTKSPNGTNTIISNNHLVNCDYPIEASNMYEVLVYGNTIPSWSTHSTLIFQDNEKLVIFGNLLNNSITLSTTGTTQIYNTDYRDSYEFQTTGEDFYFNGGDVGLSVSSPLVKLHLNDVVTTSGASRFNTLIYDDSAQAAGVGGGLLFGGDYTDAGAQTFWAGIWSEKETATSGEYGGGLHFGTRDHGSTPAERMMISAEGNVGIATTDPLAPLSVVNGGSTNTAFGVYVVQSNTNAAGWNLNSDTSGDFNIGRVAGSSVSSPKVTIDASGNVDIDTLAGSYTGGSAYVCVFDSGIIYASDSACP